MSSVTKKVLEEVPSDKVPNWLNEEFFHEILEKETGLIGDKLKTRIVSIKPAVGAGENYLAGLYRVSVEILTGDDVTPKTQSFILKCKIDLGEMANMMAMPVFNREMEMYRDFIPKFEKEYQLIGEDVRFGPKCFKATTDDPATMLVFDDLSVNGYAVQNRHKGLDFEHSKMFVEKLAKFHAASAVYQEKNGPYGPLYRSIYAKEMEESNKDFAESIFAYFIAALKRSNILSKYVDLVSKWKDAGMDDIISATSPDPNGFNVLNHGDAWVNNMMFAHNENNHPTDIRFIDFQMSYWASPIVDLYNFFLSSTETDIKATEFDNIVYCYHTELKKNLIKLGYSKKLPTLKELHIDLLNKSVFATQFSYFGMPIILLDPRDDASVSNLMDQSEKGLALKDAMYKTPRLIRALEVLYPFFEKRGML